LSGASSPSSAASSGSRSRSSTSPSAAASFLPHRRAAWRVIHGHLVLLEQEALAVKDDPEIPAKHRERLALVHENVGRMAINFARAMGLEEANK
jgi:hypothetical protein